MVIVKSSQVGISKIALDLEHNAVYDVLRRVGFNHNRLLDYPTRLLVFFGPMTLTAKLVEQPLLLAMV